MISEVKGKRYTSKYLKIIKKQKQEMADTEAVK